MGFCIVISTKGFTNRLCSPTWRLCLEGEEAGYYLHITPWQLEPISQSASCTLSRCSKHVLAGWTRSEYWLSSTSSAILFQRIPKKEPTWDWSQIDFDLRACFFHALQECYVYELGSTVCSFSTWRDNPYIKASSIVVHYWGDVWVGFVI